MITTVLLVLSIPHVETFTVMMLSELNYEPGALYDYS
jgi:hypothetical protein